MLVDGLLQTIGFSKEEEDQYLHYQHLNQSREEELARLYMRGNLSYEDAFSCLQTWETEDLPIESLSLLFFLSCTGYLLEDYQSAGIPESIFWDSMKDFRYKLTECKKAKGRFGTFVPFWYQGFFKLKRFALGRLQFDISSYDQESTVVCDYPINQGDFILSCHIPSAGPLLPELCLDSLKRAYSMFQDKIKDGILVVKCVSWILYPSYTSLFGETSNLKDFYNSFFIISSREFETFSSYLIFGKDYTGNPDDLPVQTSLQRKFVDYIKNGGTFGDGTGILLFDGEKILTKQ